MFHYLLMLLLLNTCYQSLGSPITNDISIYLSNLANTCEDAYLSKQIKSKIQECSSKEPSFGKKQVRCLIFFDMNSQLCSAVSTSKIIMNDEKTALLNNEKGVNTVCEAAKDWIFTNLTQYPGYKNAAEKAFKHPVFCGRYCAVEDDVSDDADFICKYFNWGAKLLKTPLSVQEIENSVAATAVNNKIEKTSEPTSSTNNMADVQVKTAASIANQAKLTEAVSLKSTPNKEEMNRDEDLKPEINVQATTSNKQLTEPSNNENPEKADDTDLSVKKLGEPTDVKVDDAPPNNQLEKSPGDQKPDPGYIQQSAAENELNDDVEKDADNAKAKISSDKDDYQDSDDGKDDIEDDGDNMLTDEVIKPNPEQNKTPIKVEAADLSKEYYSNTIQDGYSDDDDHFFSFFLTAVILVVLLYVLYHNKNKVSKVFFGLILEGRQSGRRRNSRGHAYRRLDTLEQAMNTNSAAPPSKIIY